MTFKMKTVYKIWIMIFHNIHKFIYPFILVSLTTLCTTTCLPGCFRGCLKYFLINHWSLSELTGNTRWDVSDKMQFLFCLVSILPVEHIWAKHQSWHLNSIDWIIGQTRTYLTVANNSFSNFIFLPNSDRDSSKLSVTSKKGSGRCLFMLTLDQRPCNLIQIYWKD